MDIKPIETLYGGSRFRSRLEARWAVFFDALNVKWEYEKEGFTLQNGEDYLPDFYLPEAEAFVEIKSGVPSYQERERARLLYSGTGKFVYIFQGLPINKFGFPKVDVFAKVTILDMLYDASEQAFFSKNDHGEFWSPIPFSYSWHKKPTTIKFQLIRQAAEKALAARFEFGESG